MGAETSLVNLKKIFIFNSSNIFWALPQWSKRVFFCDKNYKISFNKSKQEAQLTKLCFWYIDPPKKHLETYGIKKNNVNISVLTIRCSHTNFLKEISAKLILVHFMFLEALTRRWKKFKQHGWKENVYILFLQGKGRVGVLSHLAFFWTNFRKLLQKWIAWLQ